MGSSDSTVTLIGVIVGFLFGMSGIATLLDLMNSVISGAAIQLSQMNAASTLMLLVIAIILIIKIRVISALVVGAIIGAVLNLILEVNGIHVVDEVYSIVVNSLSPF